MITSHGPESAFWPVVVVTSNEVMMRCQLSLAGCVTRDRADEICYPHAGMIYGFKYASKMK
jgi:hypothetical protein